MPVHRLKEFLEENEIKFVTISHSQAFTAQQIAAAAHVPGKEMAKTVMVKLDGELAMVVLPATHQVSIPRLKKATGAGEVELASESGAIFYEVEILRPFSEPMPVEPWTWDQIKAVQGEFNGFYGWSLALESLQECTFPEKSIAVFA